jgi:hypothetical protein
MKKEKPRRLPRPRPRTLAEFFALEEEAWEGQSQ